MNPYKYLSALKSATAAAVLGITACFPVWAQNVPSLEARAELATRNGQAYLILTLPELWISDAQKYPNTVVEVYQGQPGELELQPDDPSVKPFFELSQDRKTLRLPRVRYEGTLLHNVRVKAPILFPSAPIAVSGNSGPKNVAVGLVVPGTTLSLTTLQGWPAAPADEATFCSARHVWGMLDTLVQIYGAGAGAVAGSVRYSKCMYSNGLGLIDITAEIPGGTRATVPNVSFQWLN